jgi:predicted Ser/Thr protein kinase
LFINLSQKLRNKLYLPLFNCQKHGSSVKTFEPEGNIMHTELFKNFVQPTVYVVDRIFLRRRKNCRIEYLVEWTGGD